MNGLKTGVLVRDFRKRDLRDVLEIANLSFVRESEIIGFDSEHVKKMVDTLFGIPATAFLALSRLLGKEFFKLFVAEVNARVVGTTMITRQRNVGYISTVMVHPAYRRRGIARRLVNSAVAYAKEKKVKRTVLYVIPTNYSAKNLYAELGFKEFEKIIYMAGSVDRVSPPECTEAVRVNRLQKSDMDAVYKLIKSSEDPRHLEVFDFARKDLKTTFFERLFRFSIKNRMIATLNGALIGYVETTHTTPSEAGQISNVQIHPELKGKGIEEMLIHAAVSKVKQAGIRKVIGTASARRPELIAAMVKLGFERCLELDGMVGVSIDTLRRHRALFQCLLGTLTGRYYVNENWCIR